jgi:Protein of unknown function (DUF3105)
LPESKHRRRRNRAGRTAPGGSRSATSLAAARPRKKKTNYLYLVVSALIAVLVIGGFAIGSAGFGLGTRGGSSDGYVEGVGVQQELMPTRNHVPESQSVEYSTTPPTSGDHWEVWGQCGFYDYTLPDERMVHNLEHGNIVVNYNLTSEEQVQQLRDIFNGIGEANIWGIARFYDEIPEGTIVLTAWGVMDTLQTIDEERIRTFFETYSGNLGPERIPCNQGGIVDPPPAESSGN